MSETYITSDKNLSLVSPVNILYDSYCPINLVFRYDFYDLDMFNPPDQKDENIIQIDVDIDIS